MRAVNRALVFAALCLVSCSAPMGEPELVLSLTASEIDDQGGTTVLRIEATDPAGLVGKGSVRIHSNAGTAKTEVQQDLDAYGTGRFEFSCSRALDPGCVGTVTLTVDWMINGRLVTATRNVIIVPPTLQLQGWEGDVQWDVGAQPTRCNGSSPPMAPACQNGMCARGFVCVDGACLLNGRGGGLQYTLRFGQSVDLDLHVDEPLAAGGVCEVYWSDPNRTGRPSTCGATSSLDLDSNAGCSIDGVNIENVIFPNTNNARPRAGTYVARVDLWSACMANMPITFELEVRAGGTSRFYCGSFMPSEADMGSSRAGRLISTIVIPPP